MKVRSARRALVGAGAIAVAGAVIATLLLTSSGSSESDVRTSTPISTPTREVLRALATTTGGSPSAAAKALSSLTQAIPKADEPSCPTSTDPSFKTPAAQFPNGQHGLGVPFVAALTQGEILSGYHTGPAVVQRGVSSKWGLSLTGVSGWVTGLLEVPSLATLVNKSTGIMFCDDRHYVPTGSTTEAPPHIRFDLKYGSVVANNQENYSLDKNQGGYTPWFFTLEADGTPQLGVADVEPDGAIDLQGSTPASANVTVWEGSGHSYHDAYTCVQRPGTVIDISSKASPVPADGAPGATNQFQPSPLRGGFPSSTNQTPASATLVGNDFPVAAYPFPSSACGISITLDGSLSGYNKKGLVQYPSECTPKGGSLDCPTIASPPGWSQFTVKATITTLDIPYGASGSGT